jgi:hypothetical protein
MANVKVTIDRIDDDIDSLYENFKLNIIMRPRDRRKVYLQKF